VADNWLLGNLAIWDW